MEAQGGKDVKNTKAWSAEHTTVLWPFFRYGHVLRKEDSGWVKKCIEYEVEGVRPRGRQRRLGEKLCKKDCQACKLNKEESNKDGR